MNKLEEICEGINRAKEFKGCGKTITNDRYGLCSSCLEEFIFNTEEGKEVLNAVEHIR